MVTWQSDGAVPINEHSIIQGCCCQAGLQTSQQLDDLI